MEQHQRDVVDHMKDKIDDVDEHVKVVDTRVNLFHDETEKRLNEESDRISLITGVGVGVSAALGILQIITMLAEKKNSLK